MDSTKKSGIDSGRLLRSFAKVMNALALGEIVALSLARSHPGFALRSLARVSRSSSPRASASLASLARGALGKLHSRSRLASLAFSSLAPSRRKTQASLARHSVQFTQGAVKLRMPSHPLGHVQRFALQIWDGFTWVSGISPRVRSGWSQKASLFGLNSRLGVKSDLAYARPAKPSWVNLLASRFGWVHAGLRSIWLEPQRRREFPEITFLPIFGVFFSEFQRRRDFAPIFDLYFWGNFHFRAKIFDFCSSGIFLAEILGVYGIEANFVLFRSALAFARAEQPAKAGCNGKRGKITFRWFSYRLPSVFRSSSLWEEDPLLEGIPETRDF